MAERAPIDAQNFRAPATFAAVSGDTVWSVSPEFRQKRQTHLRVVRGPTDIFDLEEEKRKREIPDLSSPETSRAVFSEQDFQELQALQREFCQAINSPYNVRDLLSRSYNPVIDVWNIRRLRKNGDINGLNAYRLEMRENHKTNLKERLKTAESYGKYIIKEEQLYSELFPEAPFEDVIQRGIDYRKQLGSEELEREKAEGVGWRECNEFLTDPTAEVGRKIRSFSPKGLVKATQYDAMFVDEYTVKEDIRGNRYIERARFAVDWSYERYIQIATRLDPHYLDDYKGEALDAWFLAHPIKNPDEIPELHVRGASEAEFEKRYSDELLQGLIQHYSDVAFSPYVNWRELAETFNTLLIHFDDIDEVNNDVRKTGSGILNRGKRMFEPVASGISYIEAAVAQKIRENGARTPVEKSGGGCPMNKGVTIGGSSENGFESSKSDKILSNSVAKFDLEEDEKGSLKFNCPVCEYENTRPRGGFVASCQNEKCPDPSKVAC